MSGTCIQRVWDGNGGDMTDCGKPVVPGKRRCKEHWKPRTKKRPDRRLNSDDMRRLRRCFHPMVQPIAGQNARLYLFASKLAKRLGVAEFEEP